MAVSPLDSVPNIKTLMSTGQAAIDTLQGEFPPAAKPADMAKSMADMLQRLFDSIGFPVTLPSIPSLPSKPVVPGLPKVASPSAISGGVGRLFDFSKVVKT